MNICAYHMNTFCPVYNECTPHNNILPVLQCVYRPYNRLFARLTIHMYIPNKWVLPGLQETAAGASFGTPAEGAADVENDGASNAGNSARGAGNDALESPVVETEPPDTGGEGEASLSPGNSSLVGSLISLSLAEAPRVRTPSP